MILACTDLKAINLVFYEIVKNKDNIKDCISIGMADIDNPKRITCHISYPYYTHSLGVESPEYGIHILYLILLYY